MEAGNAMNTLYAQIEQARDSVRVRAATEPRVGMILGSGLGGLADEITDATVLPYAEIPGFAPSSVPGHRSELALGHLAGVPVAVMRGRFHFYEGFSMQEVTFPVRVMRALGCDTLLVTNAAGGLRADWAVGDLMRITDQIFLPGMAGHHPLRGENDDRLGLRFPPMVGAFDTELAAIAHDVADEVGATLRDGVYAMVSGPAFESAAELAHATRLGRGRRRHVHRARGDRRAAQRHACAWDFIDHESGLARRTTRQPRGSARSRRSCEAKV